MRKTQRKKRFTPDYRIQYKKKSVSVPSAAQKNFRQKKSSLRKRSQSTEDLMRKRHKGRSSYWNFFLVFLIGAALGAGISFLMMEFVDTNNSGTTEECSTVSLSTSQATTNDLIEMGMQEENAETLVKARVSYGGILLDPMDLLDHDVSVS